MEEREDRGASAGKQEEQSSRVAPMTVLEETFYTASKKKAFYRVRLGEKGLSLEKQQSNGLSNKCETISYRDIVGCKCMRSKKRARASCVCRPGSMKGQARLVDSNEIIQPFEEYDSSAYLYIYAYAVKKCSYSVTTSNKSSKTGLSRRERTTVTLRFRSFDKYEDNLREASKWRLAIKCFITGHPLPSHLLSPTTNANLDTLISACPSEKKKLLVLLNPKSGSGRGREMFQKKVQTILSEAERPYELHMTKYADYARDFVRMRDIYQWSGIVIVGGDGVAFEVINGLLQRLDWERALRDVPLGLVPCGSGNGLAKSIAHFKKEAFDSNPWMISGLAIVKGKDTPMDLVRVETRKRICYSFLSVGWGFLADVDIESESLRALGAQRFALWSFTRLIGLRTYHGKLSYLPCQTTPSTTPTTTLISDHLNQEYTKISHSMSIAEQLDRQVKMRASKSYHDVGQEMKNGAPDHFDADECDSMTDAIELETTEPSGRPRLGSFYSATSKKSTYFSTGSVSSYHSIENLENDQADIEQYGEPVMYGPASQLPALTAPLPSSWVQIQGEFVMVYAAYQSHLSKDCFFSPQARPNDGIIWLLIIRAGISRSHLFQFLMGLNGATHLACPGVEMIPVKAFRIEPSENAHGHLTVDGEEVDYGPLQAEIFPSMARVMCP